MREEACNKQESRQLRRLDASIERPADRASMDSLYIVCKANRTIRLILRAISIIIILLYSTQQIAWAQGGTPIQAPQGKIGTVPRTPIPTEGDCPYFSSDKAITKEVSISGSDEVIINIQDAHDSLSAQYSIVDILGTLVKEYDLNIVALEGSSGYIDTSLLKTFPIEEVRKSTADHFMKEGQLSAGEFFSIVNEKDIELYGIEDNKLYKEHVASFTENIETKQENIKAIDALIATLEQIEESIYPQRVKELNTLSRDYKAGTIDFKTYWKKIGTGKIGTVPGTSLPIGGDCPYFPTLNKLAQSIELESKINFKSAK